MKTTSTFIISASLASLLAGCTEPVKPIFQTHSPPIEWPSPPDQPRIRYIGSLSGQASLKKPRPITLKSILAGPEPTIGFSTPMSVTARGDDVIVCDGQGGAVHHLNLQTRDFYSITRAGNEPFGWPIDVTLAGPYIAVADSKRAAVFVMNFAGQDIRTIGHGALIRPSSVSWSESRREFWVLDAGAHACVIFNEKGEETRRFGQRGESLGEFNYPAGLVCDDTLGAVIADSMNFRVQIVDPNGVPTRYFGRKGDAAGDFSLPRDVAVDSEGHIYVLDNQFENIQVFDREGRLLMAWGNEGQGPGEFYLPAAIHIDSQDRIWIADAYNRRVQVFQYLPEIKMASGEEQMAE